MLPGMAQAIPSCLPRGEDGPPVASFFLGDGEFLNGFGSAAGVAGFDLRQLGLEFLRRRGVLDFVLPKSESHKVR